MPPIETADETIPLLPDTPEGAAIRAAFLADERAVLVALAAQLTQTDAETRALRFSNLVLRRFQKF